MALSRLRMFAGPNGSGKSTIYEHLKGLNLDFGIYINADQLINGLREGIPLGDYADSSKVNDSFHHFVSSHSLYLRAAEKGYKVKLVLRDGKFPQECNKSFHYACGF